MWPPSESIIPGVTLFKSGMKSVASPEVISTPGVGDPASVLSASDNVAVNGVMGGDGGNLVGGCGGVNG